MKNRTGLIATKIGNSSFFSENGKVIPIKNINISTLKINKKQVDTKLQ